MAQKIFTVMGATGHIGQVIVEELLKRGHAVRALGRNEKKLQHLMHLGAQIWFLDIDDVDILTDSFRDAYAVFCMIPPHSTEKNYADFQDRESLAICKALLNANVHRVVNLSSMGASLPDGTGPIKGLYRNEQRLDSLKEFTMLVHLRPTFFMENLNGFIPEIQSQKMISSCLNETLAIPMVATRDIGWKAADFLDSSTPEPHLVFEFVGPKEVTMNQVVKVIGKEFDYPDLRYQHISYDAEKRRMLAAGLTEEKAALMLEMYQAFNDGLINPTEELTLPHHGTTTLEQYIQMLTHKFLHMVT